MPPFRPIALRRLGKQLELANALAPETPNTPNPFDTNTTVGVSPVLQWLSRGATSFDVAFGTTNTPPTVSSGQTGLTYTPGALSTGVTYYWRITAYSPFATVVGPLWTFSLNPTPATITDANPCLNDPPLSYQEDVTQLRNRVFVRGAGASIMANINSGESIIPIDTPSFFSTGVAYVNGLIVNYTGVYTAGQGTVIGPGAAPLATPTLALASGTGLSTGAYQYAYTWVTGAGESLPSPIGSITTYQEPTPVAPIDQGDSNLLLSTNVGNAGDLVNYICTYSIATSATDFTKESPVSSGYNHTLVSGGPAQQSPLVQITYSSDSAVKWVRIWCKNITQGNPSWVQIPCIVDNNNNPIAGVSSGSLTNITGSGTQIVMDGSPRTGGFVPSSTGSFKQVALSAIAVGASGTTSRKVYRTVVGGSQLKLQSTIADNVTTTLTDSTADGSLGANAPVSDTSGLPQPSGQVLAGATSIPTAGTATFSSTGGWALAGNTTLRYFGLSGNSLIGIPAVGNGSITTSIQYNTQIVPLSAITGVTGLTTGQVANTVINLWTQSDDLVSQAARAVIEGGDGIHEHLIDDTSLVSVSMCTARGLAELLLFANPIITITYDTLDPATASGKFVTFNLTTPLLLTGTYLIQSSTISQVDTSPNSYPRRSVKASSVKFTLQDLLRHVVLGTGTGSDHP